MGENKMILKRLNDINSIMSLENETIIGGTDENGNEFNITFSTFDLLEWLDPEYMKETLKKYLDNLTDYKNNK